MRQTVTKIKMFPHGSSMFLNKNSKESDLPLRGKINNDYIDPEFFSQYLDISL